MAAAAVIVIHAEAVLSVDADAVSWGGMNQ